jgi:hypothetical protein
MFSASAAVGPGLGSGLQVFALLAMGHFLADFGLQSDRMAVEKCRGKDHTLPWQWWLISHAAIHALVVTVLTGFVWLGVGPPHPHRLRQVPASLWPGRGSAAASELQGSLGCAAAAQRLDRLGVAAALGWLIAAAKPSLRPSCRAQLSR